jgi:hypothetical protein
MMRAMCSTFQSARSLTIDAVAPVTLTNQGVFDIAGDTVNSTVQLVNQGTLTSDRGASAINGASTSNTDTIQLLSGGGARRQ